MIMSIDYEGKTELNDEISLQALSYEIADELKEAISYKNLRCVLPENDHMIKVVIC